MVILRPDQRAAVEALYAHLRAGTRRVLVQAPTGWGKGVIAAELLRRCEAQGRRAVFVSHLSDINRDIAARARRYGCQRVGVMMGAAPEGDADPSVVVATVQTLFARRAERPQADLLIWDECFPAGTLVGGIPIELVNVGTLLPSYDAQCDALVARRVTAVFRSVPATMVRVHLADRTISCTAGHPFYTARGWVNAAHLVADDLVRTADEEVCTVRRVDSEDVEPLLLRSVHRCAEGGTKSSVARNRVALCGVRRDGASWGGTERAQFGASRSGLLLGEVQSDAGAPGCVGDAYGDQQAFCVGSDACKQSNASRRCSREDGSDAAIDRSQAEGPRWQRCCTSHAACIAGKCPRTGVACRILGSHGCLEGCRWASKSLLDRYCAPDAQDSGRSGRWIAWDAREAEERREEGCVLSWTRVDRVEILERGCDGTFGGVCPDGYVYNLEVDGTHTYVANGLVVHNCHRAAASSYADVRAAYPGAVHVGFSATPERADGASLGDAFDVLVPGPSPLELVALGCLAPVRVLAPTETTQALARDPAEAWPEGSPGVLFAHSLAHSRECAERLRARGVRAAHVDADTRDRERLIAAFNEGSLDVLCCFRLFVEGVDVPRASVVMLATLFGHAGGYLQAIGRGRRVAPGKGTCTVLDLRGNVHRHGLPDEARTYHLTGEPIRRADKLPSIVQCRKCHAWGPGGQTCSACGAQLPPPPPPKVLARDLVEVRARADGEERRFERLCRFVADAVAKGRNPWSAAHRYRGTYGEAPSRGDMVAALRAAERGTP